MLMLFAAATLFVGQIQGAPVQTRPYDMLPPGCLIGTGREPVALPLKGTTVNADVSGFGARVTVVQTFTNPSRTPIEAVYTFPLPADAAVDKMRMQVGDRVIDGVIKRREEARMIYDAAKSQGQAAALLDQERPNIFTQSVANILPGSTVKIEISYVQILKYEDGQFEFSFPMVVGPRYLGNAPDPGKIHPPVIPEGKRTGSNISLTVNLDAGAPVVDVKSVLHEVTINARNDRQAVITLRRKDEIPNKDFILRYRTATNSVQDAFVAKYDPLKGGYFSLILLPPKQPTQRQIAPREMIFVLDQSGSQRGFPIEKSKELTLKMLSTMHPNDTFNVLGFSNEVTHLWDSPRANTAENRRLAAAWISKIDANGGTELRKAVVAALTPAPDPERTRIVLFNTDGFVGDEKEILASIREHRGNSRMFTFGIGNSVNHYLIDSMSDEGRGDSETVTLAESADAAVAKLVKRLETPVLMNISATFNGVEASDLLPSAIPDVFGDKPIVIYGRYATPGQGKLTLTGTLGNQPWSQSIDLLFPSDRNGNDSIPTLWARRMIDKLEREYALGTRAAQNPVEGENAVRNLALSYGLMSQYTSFVAVEQRVINIGGKQRTVHVPVEMADGVSYEGVGLGKSARMGIAPASLSVAGPAGGGFGGGGGNFGSAGGAAGPPATGSVARRKVEVRHADPSFIAGLSDLSPEARKKLLFETKVDEKLRKATGKVEIEVWLDKLTPELVKKLGDLGMIVDVEDKGLKVVFGRCNAKILAEMASMSEVERIEPIS